MAKMVRIRPILESELDLLARTNQDPDEAGPFGFFGYRDPGQLRRTFAESGFLAEDHGSLAVALAEAQEPGDFLGDVSWHQVTTGPSSHSWNIGIALLATARGRGYGTTAQRLLAEYLFAHTQLNRVEASTEVDNAAERRSLEKAGFTFEGVLRGACFRAGSWRDMASYSMVRADLG
jgi:RimJ/RimL family protein N-acetyltransferase